MYIHKEKEGISRKVNRKNLLTFETMGGILYKKYRLFASICSKIRRKKNGGK